MISPALPRALAACFVGLALAGATGCATLSADANANVAWAEKDPATMAVVVRRADVADATVHEVNRLLASTPTGGTADWTANVALAPREKATALEDVARETVYADSHARVVTAEAWVRGLRVLHGSSAAHQSLLETVSPRVAEGFSDVLGRKLALARGDVQIEQERRDLATADLSDAVKAAHEARLLELQKARADEVAAIEPLEKAFLASAKEAAREVRGDEHEKLCSTLSSLLEALGDADLANRAAAVRYPLAVPSMRSSVEDVVPGIVAAILEERTGRRPDPKKLTARVVKVGADLTVTITGLGPKDLGPIEMASLTRETLARTATWVTHATTLLASVESTNDAIAFESEALKQILGGLTPVATPVAPEGPSETAVASRPVPSPLFGMAAATK